MSRTAASITQADISRSLRAAKQVGCKRLTIMLHDVPLIFDLDSDSTTSHNLDDQKPKEKKAIIL